jgi:molecular chaperone DnaJ
MSARRDYYDVLGVDRSASPDEVKRAYRRLARRHHPDVNPDDPEAEAKFKEVAEAYEVLGDADRRSQYDHFGQAHPMGGRTGDLWGGLGGLEDLFDTFFGARPTARRARQRRGGDLRHDLTLTLEEVATGAERTLTADRLQSCPDCEGTGSHSRTGEQACSSCRGTGQVEHTTSTPFGRLSTVTACHACQGEGQVISDPCGSCGGTGQRVGKVEIPLKIPAGVEDGGSLRLEGEGETGARGAPPGDLYLVVHVEPHEIFQRRGRDLYCEVPTPFTVAALGGDLPVPTLDGSEDLTVPPGTHSGDAFVIRGRGLPDIRTGVRGSLHARVRVVTPTQLTQRQRAILAEFAQEGGDKIDDQRGWFARFRGALSGED